MKQALFSMIAALILGSFSLTGCNEGTTANTDLSGTDEPETTAEEKEPYSPLSNTYCKLKNDKELTVAYLGGSITYGQGASTYSKNWVARTTSYLKETFPDAEVTEINAGVSNTGSNYGIFRFDDDILALGTPDLLFIEYTANDWGRFGEENISRQNESIIRRMYMENPKCDIVFLYTSLGESSSARKASQKLCDYYGLMDIDVGTATREKYTNELGGDYSSLTADKLHPTDLGYELYLNMIKDEFDAAFASAEEKGAELCDIEVPEAMNKTGIFTEPELLDPSDFPLPEGFTVKNSKFKVGKNIECDHFIESKNVGDEFEFTFTGTGFGLIVYKGEDVSDIEYSVDGGSYVNYSIGDMHYYSHTQCYICEYDLENTEHTVKIRNVASPAKTRNKDGETLRIIKLCINK